MDAHLGLCLVGLSHRSAAVAVRERYAVQPEDAPACLQGLTDGTTIAEAFLLSTCNRTEALVVAAGADDPEPAVRLQLFRNLADEHLYVFRGVHAVIHLFRVASGLDSLVLGESEIQSQVKRALEVGRSAGTIGELLLPLVTQALTVGKRVRSETEVGLGTLSVAKVAVDVAQRAFGNLASNRALVIGTGETGLLVARHLKSVGVGALDFANRTLERAQDATGELGGRAYALDQLPEALRGADVVVVCIDGGGAVLKREHVNRRARGGRDRPLLVIDLSVPRSVDPAVAGLDDVLLYGLDDLQPVVERNLRSRGEATETSSQILVAEVHKFLARRTYAAFSPAIAELPGRFKELREAVLDGVTGGKATPRELELAHELGKRLLDLALNKVKEGARRSRSTAALEAEYQRFLENL